MMVPTTDTVRNSAIVSILISNNVPTLVVGNTGTGKTCLIN